MKRAVKNLIKDRNLGHFKYIVVNVESRPSRPIGKCGDNASDEVDLHRPETDGPSPIKIVPGWIVGQWNGFMAGVIPHYWNYDERTDTHYDTTESGYFMGNLKDTNDVTYVIDTSVDDLEWTQAMAGIAYFSNNVPTFIARNNMQFEMLEFTNEVVEQLCIANRPMGSD